MQKGDTVKIKTNDWHLLDDTCLDVLAVIKTIDEKTGKVVVELTLRFDPEEVEVVEYYGK